MKSKESQEALERKQKVFTEPNGVFEWQRIDDDIKCHCEHKQSSHLDNTDICLNGLCICEKFGVEVVISPKAIARKNLPKKFAAHFNRN